MKRSRPKSIIWFERFFVASVLSETIDMFVHWDSYFFDQGGDAEARQILVITMALATVLGYAVQIALWYFIAYRASNIARWVLVIITALSLLMSAVFYQGYSGSELIFLAVTQSLMLISILCMFLRGSREWFRTKGAISSNNDKELSDIFG